jgi:hypothetical protein
VGAMVLGTETTLLENRFLEAWKIISIFLNLGQFIDYNFSELCMILIGMLIALLIYSP